MIDEPTYVIFEVENRQAAGRIRKVVIDAEKRDWNFPDNRHFIMAPDGHQMAWHFFYDGRSDYENVHKIVRKMWQWVAWAREMWNKENVL